MLDRVINYIGTVNTATKLYAVGIFSLSIAASSIAWYAPFIVSGLGCIFASIVNPIANS